MKTTAFCEFVCVCAGLFFSVKGSGASSIGCSSFVIHEKSLPSPCDTLQTTPWACTHHRYHHQPLIFVCMYVHIPRLDPMTQVYLLFSVQTPRSCSHTAWRVFESEKCLWQGRHNANVREKNGDGIKSKNFAQRLSKKKDTKKEEQGLHAEKCWKILWCGRFRSILLSRDARRDRKGSV